MNGRLENLQTLKGLIENVVQCVIDPLCYVTGNTINFEISGVLLPNGESKTFGVSVPELERVTIEEDIISEIRRIMALYEGSSGNLLRLTLADFRMAMNTPHETEFFCYRSIESMRQYFKNDEESDNKSWVRLRNELNVDRDDIEYIKQFADPRRHGDLVKISGQARKEALLLTWNLIMKFIDYLEEGKEGDG